MLIFYYFLLLLLDLSPSQGSILYPKTSLKITDFAGKLRQSGLFSLWHHNSYFIISNLSPLVIPIYQCDLFIATGFDVDDIEVYDTRPDPNLEDNLMRYLSTEVNSQQMLVLVCLPKLWILSDLGRFFWIRSWPLLYLLSLLCCLYLL